jgi:hypothetical protein
MPNRCYKCDDELTPERIIAQMNINIPFDKLTCIKCSEVVKPIGFMSESSNELGQASRKTGYVLNLLKPNDPNFKEQLRIMKRGIRRAR